MHHGTCGQYFLFQQRYDWRGENLTHTYIKRFLQTVIFGYDSQSGGEVEPRRLGEVHRKVDKLGD